MFDRLIVLNSRIKDGLQSVFLMGIGQLIHWAIHSHNRINAAFKNQSIIKKKVILQELVFSENPFVQLPKYQRF